MDDVKVEARQVERAEGLVHRFRVTITGGPRAATTWDGLTWATTREVLESIGLDTFTAGHVACRAEISGRFDWDMNRSAKRRYTCGRCRYGDHHVCHGSGSGCTCDHTAPKPMP